MKFGREWSTGELETLRATYGKVSSETIGATLGRNARAVRAKAYAIGIRLQPRWSDSDRERLRMLWGFIPVRKIASRLKRKPSAVVAMAHALGLTSEVPQGTETVSAAAERIGVAHKTLIRILKNQGVPRISTGLRAHTRVVDQGDVDEAAAAYLSRAPLNVFCRAREMDLEMVKRWMVEAARRGIINEGPPEGKHMTWRVTEEMVERALGWRASLVSVAEAAEGAGMKRDTLKDRLRTINAPLLLVGATLYLPRSEMHLVETCKSRKTMAALCRKLGLPTRRPRSVMSKTESDAK